MAKQVNPPRGMRDVLPNDKSKREWALGVIRSTYRAHGFEEIETPALENYDRLHAGLGGDNEKLSFSVLKRGVTEAELELAAKEGNAELLADLGLRFDLTVPLTRYYATNRAKLAPVFRAVQIGPVWRAERPQKGRYRQFVQADIDIIGEGGLLAELELILATSQALAALGLEGCTIRMNDRRVLTAMLTAAGFVEADHARVLISIDKLDKIGVSGVTEELAAIDSAAAAEIELMLSKILGTETLAMTLNDMRRVLPEGVSDEGLNSLAELGAALDGALPDGVSVIFDPTLVRGMGYYTGTIFEIAHPGSGSSVGGGGRYDGMVGRFLGQDVPAVGFSIGFERIIDLINVADSHKEITALIYDEQVSPQNLMKLKSELIARGVVVRLEKRQKNMKTLLGRLLDSGVKTMANVRKETTVLSDLDFKELH